MTVVVSRNDYQQSWECSPIDAVMMTLKYPLEGAVCASKDVGLLRPTMHFHRTALFPVQRFSCSTVDQAMKMVGSLSGAYLEISGTAGHGRLRAKLNWSDMSRDNQALLEMDLHAHDIVHMVDEESDALPAQPGSNANGVSVDSRGEG